MNYDKYENALGSADSLEFEFVSEGVNGAIVSEFAAAFREKLVSLREVSIPERIRLYRMVITLNLNELKNDFEIYGVNYDGNESVVKLFRNKKNYDGFIVKRKLELC